MNPGGIISTVSNIEESLIFDFIISAISNGFFFNSFDNVRAILVDQLPKDLFFGFSTIIFFEPKPGKSLHSFALSIEDSIIFEIVFWGRSYIWDSFGV